MAYALDDMSNVGGIVSVVPNFEGSGRPAWKYKPLTLFADGPKSDDAASFTFLRRSPSGGTPGTTNSALRVIQTTEPETTSFEWPLLSLLENKAMAGENSAGYFLSRKHSTGQTFGAVFEVAETVPMNNPPSGTIGCEVDISANGTDAVFPYSRIGVDLLIRKFDSGAAECEAGWGFRIQNTGSPNSLVRIGFGFYTGMKVVDAFDCSRADFQGGAALKMPAGVPISFDAGHQHLLKYDSFGLGYYAAGVFKGRWNSNGTTQSQVFAVANLPAAGNVGARSFVLDATSSAFNSVAAGGGANKVPVFDDGAVWRIG